MLTKQRRRKRRAQTARARGGEKPQLAATNGEGLRRPPARGWQGPARGEQSWLEAPQMWRGTTRQVCGLWPNVVGAGTPMVGVPLGITDEGTVLCCDPLSWMLRARLISQPSMFVLGDPGLGKSTLVRRIVIGGSAFGDVPIIPGDTRPDYVETIRRLGGQVITVGGRGGTLNIMDATVAQRAAKRLPAKAAGVVLRDAHSRRKLTIESLVSVQRQSPPNELERNIIDRAIHILDDTHDGIPTLHDLVKLIESGPEELRAMARDDGSGSQYHGSLLPLIQTFEGMLAGEIGQMFAGQTTEPMAHDRPVVFDVSHIEQAADDTRAAALMACWASAFANIAVADELAVHGKEPRRRYLIVMDELWSAISVSSGLVDRVNALTRLNRKIAASQILISHTKRDLEAMTDEADKAKAMGFLDRSAIKVVFGLSRDDVRLLSGSVRLTNAETERVVGWSSPPGFRSDGAGNERPPGEGQALVKVGERPGIAFRVLLTEAEQSSRVHDTNIKYEETVGVDTDG